jgi:hypothetical protein
MLAVVVTVVSGSSEQTISFTSGTQMVLKNGLGRLVVPKELESTRMEFLGSSPQVTRSTRETVKIGKKCQALQKTSRSEEMEQSGS